MRASGMRSGRTPGSSSCSHRGCGSGARSATATAASRSSRNRRRRPGLRSSACAPASCTRSRSRTTCSCGGRVQDRDYSRAARGRLLRRRQLLRARRHLLLRLDGNRAQGRERLRPGADGDPRRRAPAAGRGRQRARGGGAGRAAGPARRRPPTSRPRAPPSRARGTRWAGSWTPPTCTGCSARNLEHPRWDEVAERCLTCGNCTMACPTCFCTSVEDTTDLTGQSAERHARLGLVLLGRLLATSTAARSGPAAARATGSG